MCIPTTLRSQVLTNRTTQLRIVLAQLSCIVAIVSHQRFQLSTVTLHDSILTCHIQVRVTLNMQGRVLAQRFALINSRFTIGQNSYLLLEILDIIEQRVSTFLNLHRLVVPLLRLLRVIAVSGLEITVQLRVTHIRCSNRRMQTIVHQRKTVEDIRTYVQRQHGGEHQVHHTNHFLSRGFRTVFCSTHY